MTEENTRGLTPGRKIKAAIWMSFTVTLCATVLSKIKAPDPVISQAIWIIGLGWLGVILGQSGIDALGKFAESRKPPTDLTVK